MYRVVTLLLLLALSLPVESQAPDDSEGFRFVRPVHAVQNKRIRKRMPASDVNTFRPGASAAATDPPEVTIGERLFIDTRFAQYFAANYDGNVNHPLTTGDPTLDTVQVKGQTVKGPFATRSINCRSCHFVAEFGYLGNGNNRTYVDFAQRSAIPARADGQRTTERNSMSMVDSFVDRNGITLLHADGEFATVEDLVKSTLTGRNFGWLPSEYDKAVAHIAKVIRQDDGTDAISYRYGGGYAKVLAGTDPNIHPMFRLPKEYTIDVATASDQQILEAVGKLIGAYLDSLTFARDNNAVFAGSPYDLFLKLNDLPAIPEKGETDAQYTARLRKAVEGLDKPKFVDEDAQTTWFQYHKQKFNFGPQELEGLKIFLRVQETSAGNAKKSANAHVANCTTCHTPPDFTDRGFHNNGASQEEYDSVHGAGRFAKLKIPSYEERLRQFDRYLPATPKHPNASGMFRRVPSADNAAAADLGLWNIYANADFPRPQSQMQKLLCKLGASCDPKMVLPLTIARFRTPPLRDLEDSSPFMHTGRFQTIEDVLHYYIRTSELARRGEIRNGAAEIGGITIDEDDVAALAAFLRSLNEDYD